MSDHHLGFWGVQVSSLAGPTPLTCPSDLCLRISSAALADVPSSSSSSPSFTQLIIIDHDAPTQTNVATNSKKPANGNAKNEKSRNEYVVCNLSSSQPHASLDLYFTADRQVQIRVNGPNAIHLCGYYTLLESDTIQHPGLTDEYDEEEDSDYEEEDDDADDDHEQNDHGIFQFRGIGDELDEDDDDDEDDEVEMNQHEPGKVQVLASDDDDEEDAATSKKNKRINKLKAILPATSSPKLNSNSIHAAAAAVSPSPKLIAQLQQQLQGNNNANKKRKQDNAPSSSSSSSLSSSSSSSAPSTPATKKAKNVTSAAAPATANKLAATTKQDKKPATPAAASLAFKCDQCDRSFGMESAMQQHKQTKHGQNNK